MQDIVTTDGSTLVSSPDEVEEGAGHRAQQALRREFLAAAVAAWERLDPLLGSMAGRQLLDQLPPWWNAFDCLMWFDSPNAYLNGSTPADDIEQGNRRDLSDAIRLAARRANPKDE